MAAQETALSTTLIVGMGVTGLSCARFLQRHGVPWQIIDSRLTPPLLQQFQNEFPGQTATLGSFQDTALHGIQTLLLSPGIPRRHPFVQLALSKGVEVIGDIELFCRYAAAPIIAITGSNGKSTVTTLVGEILRSSGKAVAVGGNLGIAALDLLSEPLPDFYVLELSSFQLELTESLTAHAAVVLNISEDHMDRYSAIAEYVDSKARIYRDAANCIVNKDDARVMQMNMPAKARLTCFSADEPANDEFGVCIDDGRRWLAYGERLLLPADEMKLQGNHNCLNALAAMALTQAAGVPPEEALSAVKEFSGLPHRCQLVVKHAGVCWINDSKATNVGAAEAAIQSIDTPLILIAGGDGKGADFTHLRKAVSRTTHTVILFGRDAALLEAALCDISRCILVADMQQAVTQAAHLARSGDTVLLAPACSSLDMYKDYQARGDEFIKYVKQVVVQ